MLSLFLGLLLLFCVFCRCFALRSVLFLLLVTRCNALHIFLVVGNKTCQGVGDHWSGVFAEFASELVKGYTVYRFTTSLLDSTLLS